MNPYTAHTTQNELEFIDALGTSKYSKLSQSELLKKYIGAIKLRKDWGEMDRQAVINHAMKRYLNATN